jgi:hypothetical protein
MFTARKMFSLCVQDYGGTVKILRLGFVVGEGTRIPAFPSSFCVASRIQKTGKGKKL